MKMVCECRHEIMDINKKLGWFVKKNWDAFDDDKTSVEPAIAFEDISHGVPETIDFMDDGLIDPQDPIAMDNFVEDRGEPSLAMYGPDPEPEPPAMLKKCRQNQRDIIKIQAIPSKFN